jgi:hypothetical protein
MTPRTVLAHGLGITAAVAVVMLATLLPFLPGGYDTFAAPLSLMARVFGFVGLLLVPVGAFWVASGHSRRLAGKQFGIAIAALIASSVVWVLVSLGALATSGVVLGVGAMAFSIYVVSRVWPRLRLLKGATPRGTSAAAYYLLIVPIAVTLLQMALVPRAIEFSRHRAIRNSAPLIAEIERHRAAHGRYPASLWSVHADIHPGIIGIEKYHYEPSGDAYNLLFEQPALHFGTREFVVYNPLHQQTVTSHRLDRLQLTPSELVLEHTRGHNAVHDAGYPHWKYFWFD